MSAAAKGARAEREARAYLEKCGAFVIKGGGSKGPADLVAIYPGAVLLVQVKCGRSRLRPPEHNALYELARRYAAVPILAERVDREPMAWFRLEGPKGLGGRRQPYSAVDPAWWEESTPRSVEVPLLEDLERLRMVSGVDPRGPVTSPG